MTARIHPQPSPRTGGFTLVEAVLAIVVIGIIGAIVAVFIRSPILGYVDTVARAEASDEADLALRRMARDIRLALPNSVRVSQEGDAIEFLLTTTGGRYLALEDEAATGTPLDFVNDVRSFTVVGGLRADVAAGQFVVVHNLGQGNAPADAWDVDGPQRNIARVAAAADAGADTLQLEDNPFARQAAPMPSPGRRFQVVAGAVMFRCEAEGAGFVLRRYAGHAIERDLPATPRNPASVAVLARRVAGCASVFAYGVGDSELRRSALVLLALTLHTRNTGDAAGGPVRLVHQVHVDNTP